MKLQFFSLLFVALLFCHAVNAQTDAVTSAYQQDVKIRKTGMLILGSWAIGNMLVGGIGRQQLSGEKAYFHEMNLIWNVVNLGIAGAGYYFTAKGDLPNSALEQIGNQVSFQKTLLFNAGLDVAYIIGGFYLMEKAKNTIKKPERLRGYGKSIIMQGGFLMAFDLILHTVHSKNVASLSELISHVAVGPQQIGFVYQF